MDKAEAIEKAKPYLKTSPIVWVGFDVIFKKETLAKRYERLEETKLIMVTNDDLKAAEIKVSAPIKTKRVAKKSK